MVGRILLAHSTWQRRQSQRALCTSYLMRVNARLYALLFWHSLIKESQSTTVLHSYAYSSQKVGQSGV